jgi:hypothetical protein
MEVLRSLGADSKQLIEFEQEGGGSICSELYETPGLRSRRAAHWIGYCDAGNRDLEDIEQC